MTTALGGVRGQRHALAALYPRKDPVPIEQGVAWAPKSVWTGAENIAPPPTGIWSPDRPAPIHSLYRLFYPALIGQISVKFDVGDFFNEKSMYKFQICSQPEKKKKTSLTVRADLRRVRYSQRHKFAMTELLCITGYFPIVDSDNSSQ